MNNSLKVEYVLPSDLGKNSRFAKFRDPSGQLRFSEAQKSVYLNNPFVSGRDFPIRIVGIVEDVVIGGISPLPLQIVADQKVYDVTAGCAIYVMDEYRNTGLGMDLPRLCMEQVADQVSLNAGLSARGRRLCKLLKAGVFDFTQYLYVRNSSSLVRQKLSGWKAVVVTTMWNVVAVAQRTILRLYGNWKLRGLQIKYLSVDDESVLQKICALIAKDTHRFRENVNSEFLRWALECDFLCYGVCKKMLMGIFKGDDLIGFVFGKSYAHKTSARIIEWQMVREYESLED